MLKNRLLAIGVMLFLTGAAITIYIGGIVLPLCIVAVFVLCILLCTVRFFKQAVRYSAIFMLLPILGAVYVFFFRNVFVLPFSVFDEKTDTVTGTIISVSQSGCDISVTSSAANIPKGTVIRVYSDERLLIGDSLTFKGKLKYVGEKTNLIASDIKLYSWPLSITSNQESGIITNFRRSTYAAFDTVGQEHSEFLKAIIFNDKSGIGKERYAMYRNAGAAAYFSVSGLHVSFLVMALFNILRYFKINRILQGILLISIALLYGTIAGFTPSVLRAIVMILFIIISQMLIIESDSVTSLFFALGLLLLQNPFSVASISLQLSFLATLGTLYVGSVFSHFSKKNPLKSLLFGIFIIPASTSLACFTFTLPITFFAFDVISLISPISNILLSVIFAPLILLAFLITIFAQCVPIFGIIKYPVILLIDAFDAVCRFMSSDIKLLLPTGNAFAASAAIIGAITVVIVLTIPRRAHAVTFAVSCIIIFTTVITGAFVVKKSAETAYSIAYKQGYNGEHSVVAICGGEKIFIDYGTGFDESFVYSCGITNIDTYVAAVFTHDIYSDLSYMIKCFGTKRLLTLSEIPPEYEQSIADFSDEHRDFDIICDDIYMAGTPNKGLAIEREYTALYNQNEAFMISQGNGIKDNVHLAGAVFTSSANYLLKDELLFIDRIYCSNNVKSDDETSKYISYLEYGSIVKAVIKKDSKIEVKTNES